MRKPLPRLTAEQLANKQTAQEQIKTWKPQSDYLACFDMDGHLLDSMTAKQVLVFHPVFMDKFGLRPIEPFYRYHAENHNLWTEDRGCDRHVAKALSLESLLEDPVLGQKLPSALADRMKSIKDAIDGYISWKDKQGEVFSFDSLQRYSMENASNEYLWGMTQWSFACDHEFAFVTIPMKPFKGVRETLSYLADKGADIWIVSKTPYEDISNWLQKQDLWQYTTGVAGKEMGGKDEHICWLKGGEYDSKQPKDKQIVKIGASYSDDKVIMGGDGGGDLKAVKVNNGLFFGTPPGQEDDIWTSSIGEVFDPWLQGSYAGEIEKKKIEEFENAMRPKGFWKKDSYRTIDDFVNLYSELDATRQDLYNTIKPGGKLVKAEDVKSAFERL